MEPWYRGHAEGLDELLPCMLVYLFLFTEYIVIQCFEQVQNIVYKPEFHATILSNLSSNEAFKWYHADQTSALKLVPAPLCI